MLGPGFESVRDTGVSTVGRVRAVGGVTIVEVTDEGDFLCFRRQGRGAMACPLILYVDKIWNGILQAGYI